MPTYDYRCDVCNEINEVQQSIKDDKLEKTYCKKCGKETGCKRIITYNYCTPIFKGNDWTVKSSGFGKRGYKGKYQNLIRPGGCPVDAPASKIEADKQFQNWVDTGGLHGIKPTVKSKDDVSRPMSGEERIDKGKS